MNSTLGQKKRMDGMARIMARAGKGLFFKIPDKQGGNETADSCSEDEDRDLDDNDEDRPFEPLLVWKSPHQGGEARGLPPSMYVQILSASYVSIYPDASNHLTTS